MASSVAKAKAAAASMPSGAGAPRAMGVDRVPYDNYLIRAHEGEKLLTAQETRQQESGSGGINLSGMVINVAGSIVGYEGLEDLTDNIVEVMSRKLSKVAANMA